MTAEAPARESAQAAARRARSHGRVRLANAGWSALPWAVMGAGLVIVLVPVMWLVTTSFKVSVDYLAYPPRLLPRTWTTEGYRILFQQNQLGHFFANSVIITLA